MASIAVRGGQRVVFPWERGLIKPELKTNSAGEYLDPWSVGFDLDGVFLADIPLEMYQTDLQQALKLRAQASAFENRPPQYSECMNAAIITGRLDSEYAETKDWLHTHNISHGSLFMRPSLEVCPARFKADTIKALNVTEFVESERWQAVEIANPAPYCVVWHYMAETGLAERIYPA